MYSLSMLDSSHAWSAQSAVAAWMTIDLQTHRVSTWGLRVSGVVTQGKNGADEWVTRYTCEYSQHASASGSNSAHWTPVDLGHVFHGNSDRGTKVASTFSVPVVAQKVKITVVAWHGEISMRAGVVVAPGEPMILNPPQGSRRWSSIDSSTTVAYDAMLDSPTSWVSENPLNAPGQYKDANQWMSMDLGAVHTVSGVVTQGRGDADQWVTLFTIDYSTLPDPNSSINPCQATFTPNASFKATDYGSLYPTQTLVEDAAKADPNALGYWQRNTGEFQLLKRGNNTWGTSLPNDSVGVWAKTCGYTRVGTNDDIFKGNSDRDTKVVSMFPVTVDARWVKINVREWNVGIAMRAGVLVGLVGDAEFFRMRDMAGMSVSDERIINPPDDFALGVNVRASPTIFNSNCVVGPNSNCVVGPNMGTSNRRSYSNYIAMLLRSSLLSPDSWSGYNGPTYWARVDLGSAYMGTGVVTRGRGNDAQWVTVYTCKVSLDGSTWEEVKDASGTAQKRFTGNTDQNTLVEGIFPTPVLAKHVELTAENWNGHPSMRFAVLVVGLPDVPVGALTIRNHSPPMPADSSGTSKYHISAWDTSLITDMSSLFKASTGTSPPFNFKSACNPPIANWNVSRVTNFERMFVGAQSFNQCVASWDMSNATSTHAMFRGAVAFNQPLNDWNMSKVTDFYTMFAGARNFNQPIGKWDTSKVTDMHGMFEEAGAFNQDLNQWDVSSVTAMSSMFYQAHSFNGNISSWVVSNCEIMALMFMDATAFNQDISGWNVGKVAGRSRWPCNGKDPCPGYQGMDKMFLHANSFQHDISNWGLNSGVTGSSFWSSSRADNYYCQILNSSPKRVVCTCAPGNNSCSGHGTCTNTATPPTLGVSHTCDCDAGYARTQSSSLACIACPVGEYRYKGSPPVSLDCISCAVGKYTSSIAQISCRVCGSGKYVSLTGQSSCFGCSSGKYVSLTGQSSCIGCAAGKFGSSLTDVALHDEESDCISCAVGKYTSSTGQLSCVICSSGKYVSLTGQSSCIGCAAGKFGSSLTDVGLHDEESDCISCAVGKYTSSSAQLSCTSVSCGLGKYGSSTGQTTCILCGAGRYISMTNATSCRVCDGGRYVASSGQTSCIGCVSGRFGVSSVDSQKHDADTDCISCGVGKYGSSTGQTTCILCGAGRYISMTNATSCIVCGGGRYVSTLGQTSCIGCPSGKFGVSDIEPRRHDTDTDCISCGVGKYGSSTGQTTCILCGVGRYISMTSATSCIVCGGGRYVSTTLA